MTSTFLEHTLLPYNTFTLLSNGIANIEHTAYVCWLNAGPIDVYTDCTVDIAEPLSMDDVILGLAVQDASPFNIKICKLDVNNYHHREKHSFKWLLGNVDEQVCWLTDIIYLTLTTLN